MEKTCIIYGSSTGTCQAIAENIAGKLGVGAADVLDVSSIDASTPDAYTNLILGTSTWGAGELQDDWYDGLEALKQANLAGKTIALFGCGDSESYGDTFVRLSARYTMHLKTAEQSLSVPFRQTATPMTIQLPW